MTAPRDRDLDSGWPPTVQEGFIRVEVIRRAERPDLSFAVPDRCRYGSGPFLPGLIRVAKQHVFILSVSAEPFEHSGGRAGAVGVHGHRIGFAPDLVDLLRGDEQIEQAFQHDQRAGGCRDAPAAQRLNAIAPGLVMLFRLERPRVLGQLLFRNEAHVHDGGMCRWIGIHHSTSPQPGPVTADH
jgi:hypothetical protein